MVIMIALLGRYNEACRTRQLQDQQNEEHLYNSSPHGSALNGTRSDLASEEELDGWVLISPQDYEEQTSPEHFCESEPSEFDLNSEGQADSI